MPLVICFPTLQHMLFNQVQPNGATYPEKIGLYTNPVGITPNSVFADLTELVAGWYTRITLTGWTALSALDPYRRVEAAPVTWLNNAGAGGNVVVYGYFVLNLDGTLAWAENFSSGPVTVQGAGETLSLTPYLELLNE